jgi:FxsC-like protein
MGVWFFFSYSGRDRDENLDSFRKDLTRQVSRIQQLDEAQTCFFAERSIALGDVWNEQLTDALRTARVLVAICSESYLASEPCGKEMQACLERVAGSQGKAAILPVIWRPPERSLHPAFEKYQFWHDDLPKVYKDAGLEAVITQLGDQRAYERIVAKLGEAIATAGASHPLPELRSVPAWDGLKNAFAKPPQAANRGLKQALFAYVAASHRDVPSELAARYGDESKEWKPFHPNCADEVGIIAQDVSSQQRLFYKDLPVDAQLIKRIEEAETKKELVLIIVDPLTIRVKTYAEYMRDYDKRYWDNSAVLVPWNPEHGEAERDELRKRLAYAFPHRAAERKSIYYLDSIVSHKNFRQALSNTIVKLRNNMIQSSEALRPIDDADLRKRAEEEGIETQKLSLVSGPGERRL